MSSTFSKCGPEDSNNLKPPKESARDGRVCIRGLAVTVVNGKFGWLMWRVIHVTLEQLAERILSAARVSSNCSRACKPQIGFPRGKIKFQGEPVRDSVFLCPLAHGRMLDEDRLRRDMVGLLRGSTFVARTLSM